MFFVTHPDSGPIPNDNDLIYFLFRAWGEREGKKKQNSVIALRWSHYDYVTQIRFLFNIWHKRQNFTFCIYREREKETDRQTTRIRNYGLYWKIYTCVIFQFDLSPILAYEVYGITTYKSELQIVIFLLQILVQQYFILFNIIWHFNVLCIWSIYFFFHLCEDVKTPR